MDIEERTNMKNDESSPPAPKVETSSSSNLRVIVIGPHYSTFIKGLVDAMAAGVRGVDVVVYHNSLAEISEYIPLGGRFSKMRRYSVKRIIDSGKRPDNVSVSVVNGFRGVFKRDTIGYCDYVGNKIDSKIKKLDLKFDLVHSHFAWPFGYIGNIVASRHKVPHVLTGHGYDVYSLPFKNDEWNGTMKSIFEKADQITTVSKRNINCLKQLGVSRPISLIANGFPSQMFFKQDKTACRSKLGLPIDRKIILSVGNIAQVKGHSYLVDAFEQLCKARDDLMCVIVGSGELDHEISAMIQERNLQEKMILAGEKPYSEIPAWMNACDIFCLPSLSEGNPTVLFESLACGKPFVGSDVGGIPEVINSDSFGFLSRPGDSTDLADKLLKGINRHWDENAIIEYSKSFSWERIASEYRKVYERAISRSN